MVRDATQDDRFVTHPLVTQGPCIRFYAGAPLRTADGHALGTLCVMDRVPRQLTKEQADALLALGHEVMTELEVRRARRDPAAGAELERTHMEAPLKNNEERLRDLFDEAPIAAVSFTPTPPFPLQGGGSRGGFQSSE